MIATNPRTCSTPTPYIEIVYGGLYICQRGMYPGYKIDEMALRIYRRLAAALGYPLGIADDAITISLPEDSYGFLPAIPIRLNIRIAQVTSRVLSGRSAMYLTCTAVQLTRPQDIYCFTPPEKFDLTSRVITLLREIYSITQEIPPDLVFGLCQTSGNLQTSRSSLRTSASIHLMLYQVQSYP